MPSRSPTAFHPDARSRQDPPDAGNVPTPRAVVGEIGLLLAVHLGIALALALGLRALGIG